MSLDETESDYDEDDEHDESMSGVENENENDESGGTNPQTEKMPTTKNQTLKSTITIECSRMNESRFHGTINYTEAKEKIFTKALGLPTEILTAFTKFSIQ